jgi:hypothetical protein
MWFVLATETPEASTPCSPTSNARPGLRSIALPKLREYFVEMTVLAA